MKLAKVLHSLTLVGRVFQNPDTLIEKAVWPNLVELNCAEQSPLAEAVVVLVLLLQYRTNCLRGGGAMGDFKQQTGIGKA